MLWYPFELLRKGKRREEGDDKFLFLIDYLTTIYTSIIIYSLIMCFIKEISMRSGLIQLMCLIEKILIIYGINIANIVLT